MTHELESKFIVVFRVAFSASIKGGFNGTKGRWESPKDWDWSVTPGRLIPVSEATDDVPTPGYRMPQLQQRIPPHHELQPLPISNLAVTNDTAEEKVVVIGQRQPSQRDSEETKVTNDLSTTERSETTKVFEQSSSKEMNLQPALDEQELILLQDEPIVYRKESASFETTSTTEKMPVVEEPMKKVVLPEVCSISGMGCRDPKPVPQQPNVETTTVVEEHTEVFKHPKVILHPHVVRQDEVQKTEEASRTEESTEETTAHNTAFEEQTTDRHQFPSDIHHVHEHTVQQGQEPIISSSETTLDESLTNNTSVSVPSNETSTSQETVTSGLPHFNLTIPTVVHSVISSVSEYVGFNNSSKHETDSHEMKNMTEPSQHAVNDAQIHLQQQEQQIQQEQFYSHGQLPQEAEVHQVDEQKLLEIANSWGSSFENSSEHSTNRRIDEGLKQEKHEAGVTEVSIVTKEEVASIRHEMNEMTHSPEHEKSTESPSLGDRLESYWKAATGYVSKALNL